jgi:hypothetical protein
MSSFLDQLNLRPQEKRIAMAVMVGVVLLLSALFVWPKLGEWQKSQEALAKSHKTLAAYQTEIAKIPAYESRLRDLEGQGSAVLPEEQALQLTRTVQTQAQKEHVPITSTRAGTPTPASSSNTNSFFDEQTVLIGVNTREKELVGFLYSLGSGSSMIRVRDMDLRPDPPRYRLNGSITLVASYQKKPKVVPRPAAPPRAATVLTNSPAVKPGATNKL